MKKCSIFWKGQSKSGNYYLGVDYEVSGFIFKRFVRVTELKYADLPESGEVNIPEEALST